MFFIKEVKAMNRYKVEFRYFNKNSAPCSGTHVSSTVVAETSADARAIIESKYYKVQWKSIQKV